MLIPRGVGQPAAGMAGAGGDRSLIGYFSVLEDPHQPGKILYPLPEVMLLVLCATLSRCGN